jgi:uncharacterized membrane protein
VKVLQDQVRAKKRATMMSQLSRRRPSRAQEEVEQLSEKLKTDGLRACPFLPNKVQMDEETRSDPGGRAQEAGVSRKQPANREMR